MYELNNFKKIFDTIIDPSSNARELEAEIKTEPARILHALTNTIVELDQENSRQYIALHQQALHILLDETDINPAQAARQIIKTFRSATENLLFDLQKYFPDQFDQQLKIPRSLSEKSKLELEQKLMPLFNHNIQPQAMETLKEILSAVNTEQKQLSYQQKTYIDFFIEALDTSLQETQRPVEKMDIILLTISLNFNHPKFYQLCTHYFNIEIEKCEELSEQHRLLNILTKYIKQTTPVIKEQYEPELPTISESLLHYLASETEYLNSMDKIGAHLNHQGLLDNRYKVTLTVKQLAIFIHLQVQAKIIVTESPKQLHEYISKHYSTNDTDRISAKSFKNAYYSSSTEDLEKVIDKIVTMLAAAQEKL